MRLTCPNCGAQYEVPPEAIPPSGREVQCSACQKLWFERGAASPAPHRVDQEPWESLPRAEDVEEEEDDLADVATAPLPQAPPRPRVDPEVSRILREEAEREREARAAEVASDVPAPRPTPPRRLHARGDAEAAPPAPPVVPPSTPQPALSAARPAVRPARPVEREVDPDQISSTLRSQPERPATAPVRPEPAPAPRQSGFGRGFVGALLVLALLTACYLFRAEMTGVVPAAAAVLDPYAQAVDAGRAWLNDLVGRLIGVTPAAE